MNQNCPDCGNPIGKNAYKCRCGWKTSGATAERQIIPCAYSDCVRPALARVHTKTGWANVCEYHYGVTNFTRPVTHSPVVQAVLEAYRNPHREREGDADGVRQASAGSSGSGGETVFP